MNVKGPIAILQDVFWGVKKIRKHGVFACFYGKTRNLMWYHCNLFVSFLEILRFRFPTLQGSKVFPLVNHLVPHHPFRTRVRQRKAPKGSSITRIHLQKAEDVMGVVIGRGFTNNRMASDKVDRIVQRNLGPEEGERLHSTYKRKLSNLRRDGLPTHSNTSSDLTNQMLCSSSKVAHFRLADLTSRNRYRLSTCKDQSFASRALCTIPLHHPSEEKHPSCSSQWWEPEIGTAICQSEYQLIQIPRDSKRFPEIPRFNTSKAHWKLKP